MVNVKPGVLITCDPAMKQLLVHLDAEKKLGASFIIKDLDETHVLVDRDIVTVLEREIDNLMDQLSPDLAER